MHQPDGDGSQKNEIKKMSLIPGKWIKSLLNFSLIAIIGPLSKVLCFGLKLVCKFPEWMQMPSYLETDLHFYFSILLLLHLSCMLHWACRWLLLCDSVVIKYSLNNSTVSLRPDRHVECILSFWAFQLVWFSFRFNFLDDWKLFFSVTFFFFAWVGTEKSLKAPLMVTHSRYSISPSSHCQFRTNGLVLQVFFAVLQVLPTQ